MKRRTILKKLALVSGGVVLAPSCNLVNEKQVLEAYSNLNITKDDHEIMGNLCEILIPSDSNYKGAKDLGIESFVLVMVDDCLSREEQNDFLKGWKEFNQYSIKKDINPLRVFDKKKWEEMVLTIFQWQANVEKKGNDVLETGWKNKVYFLKTVKHFSILGYVTSEYYMTAIMPYKMAPGKFKGSIPFKQQDKVNLYG